MVMVTTSAKMVLLLIRKEVYSDPLKFLIEQREVQPQFQRWLTKLLGYDLEILYQLRLQNKVVDALSRVNHPVEISILSTMNSGYGGSLKQSQEGKGIATNSQHIKGKSEGET